MDIGILGAGQMGRTLARALLDAGHHVMLANSRGPESLAPLVQELGRGARAGTPADVARFGDVVILATRWNQTPAAVRGMGPVEGKIVIDPTNSRVRPRPEDLIDLGGRTSSEVVAEMLPGARLVKAFNHQPIPALGELRAFRGEARRALFLAGDDAEAKRVVARLVIDLGGEPIDTGMLREGGALQGTGNPLAGHGRLLSVVEGQSLFAQHLLARGCAGVDPEAVVAKWVDAEGTTRERLAFARSGDGFLAQSILVDASAEGDIRLSYRIDGDASWRTRRVTVEARTPVRDLEVTADGNGHWFDVRGQPIPDLDGVLDVDVSATPFTNTLPIRRLDLAVGASEDVDVAYVQVPSLELARARHRYTRVGPRRFRFEALDDDFVRDVDVDDRGLVLDYPGLFQRLGNGRRPRREAQPASEN